MQIISLTNIILVTFLAVFAYCQNPWDPTPITDQWWMDMHTRFVQNTIENGTNVTALFIGSSVMEFWQNEGAELWNSKYAALGAVNYGIRGDRTEHVLWRIENGEIDGLSPKVVVIYVGSNNVVPNTNGDTVRGITTVISTFRRKLPQTPILYMGVFPRGNHAPVNQTFERILAINDEVFRASNDNVMVNVLNIFWDLAESMGQLKSELYTSDLLHLSKLGYDQWDVSMNETFYRLWNA